MHINFQTYRTIKRTLAQVLHTRAGSPAEQHLNTLSLMICRIVGAQHVQFDKLASHAPIRGRKNESLITRFRRWSSTPPSPLTLCGCRSPARCWPVWPRHP